MLLTLIQIICHIKSNQFFIKFLATNRSNSQEHVTSRRHWNNGIWISAIEQGQELSGHCPDHHHCRPDRHCVHHHWSQFKQTLKGSLINDGSQIIMDKEPWSNG